MVIDCRVQNNIQFSLNTIINYLNGHKNKMNERLKQLATSAQVEHCISHTRLQEFADLIISDVINEIANANIQHCALTTHDLGVVNCTESKITNHILRTYEIKQQFGIFK
jgi:DNA-binding ferritin-like protein